MRHANYRVLVNAHDRIVLEDLGPWSKYPTITNDAEWVVAQVAPALNGRRLYYFDTEGRCDELRVIDGKFAGFFPSPQKTL